jgi:hypothetical protein
MAYTITSAALTVACIITGLAVPWLVHKVIVLQAVISIDNAVTAVCARPSKPTRAQVKLVVDIEAVDKAKEPFTKRGLVAALGTDICVTARGSVEEVVGVIKADGSVLCCSNLKLTLRGNCAGLQLTANRHKRPRLRVHRRCAYLSLRGG